MKIDWKQLLLDAIPAVGATAGGLYVYRRKGSLPLAFLGAFGGYGATLAVQKLLRWLASSVAPLPTKTAELPKTADTALPAAPPSSSSSTGVATPVGVQGMAGIVTRPDGSTQQARVSLIDDSADGEERDGQVLPFSGGRR